MARNPQVLVQIQKIDDILKESGVSSFCMDCIHGPEGGCCQGCASLGPNGCTDKPLSCALWLCHEAKQQFPEVRAELMTINRKYDYGIANSYRQLSITMEQYLK